MAEEEIIRYREREFHTGEGAQKEKKRDENRDKYEGRTDLTDAEKEVMRELDAAGPVREVFTPVVETPIVEEKIEVAQIVDAREKQTIINYRVCANTGNCSVAGTRTILREDAKYCGNCGYESKMVRVAPENAVTIVIRERESALEAAAATVSDASEQTQATMEAREYLAALQKKYDLPGFERFKSDMLEYQAERTLIIRYLKAALQETASQGEVFKMREESVCITEEETVEKGFWRKRSVPKKIERGVLSINYASDRHPHLIFVCTTDRSHQKVIEETYRAISACIGGKSSQLSLKFQQ